MQRSSLLVIIGCLCLVGAVANHWVKRSPSPDPGPAALIGEGAGRLQQGDNDGAIALFTQAIERYPGLPEAHHNRGLARQRKADLDGAVAD